MSAVRSRLEKCARTRSHEDYLRGENENLRIRGAPDWFRKSVAGSVLHARRKGRDLLFFCQDLRYITHNRRHSSPLFSRNKNFTRSNVSYHAPRDNPFRYVSVDWCENSETPFPVASMLALTTCTIHSFADVRSLSREREFRRSFYFNGGIPSFSRFITPEKNWVTSYFSTS